MVSLSLAKGELKGGLLDKTSIQWGLGPLRQRHEAVCISSLLQSIAIQ
jgi:hypothetical protein